MFSTAALIGVAVPPLQWKLGEICLTVWSSSNFGACTGCHGEWVGDCKSPVRQAVYSNWKSMAQWTVKKSSSYFFETVSKVFTKVTREWDRRLHWKKNIRGSRPKNLCITVGAYLRLKVPAPEPCSSPCWVEVGGHRNYWRTSNIFYPSSLPWCPIHKIWSSTMTDGTIQLRLCGSAVTPASHRSRPWCCCCVSHMSAARWPRSLLSRGHQWCICPGPSASWEPHRLSFWMTSNKPRLHNFERLGIYASSAITLATYSRALPVAAKLICK